MMFVRRFYCGNRSDIILIYRGNYFIDESIGTDDFGMQYRNMTTVLTREYLDARPDGWLEYAAKRIAQLYGYEQSCVLVYLFHFLFISLEHVK
jgi:hypothetical protein